MTGDRSERSVSLELTAGELALVLAAVELLLDAEDDTEAIDELKDLLARLRRLP